MDLVSRTSFEHKWKSRVQMVSIERAYRSQLIYESIQNNMSFAWIMNWFESLSGILLASWVELIRFLGKPLESLVESILDFGRVTWSVQIKLSRTKVDWFIYWWHRQSTKPCAFLHLCGLHLTDLTNIKTCCITNTVSITRICFYQFIKCIDCKVPSWLQFWGNM